MAMRKSRFTKGQIAHPLRPRLLGLVGAPSETRTPDTLISSCVGHCPPMFSRYSI